MRAKEFIQEVETYQPPELAVGDDILKGKFKNSPAKITGFKKDKHNQPVLKTNKGDVQLFKPRVKKLMSESDVIQYMKRRDTMLRETLSVDFSVTRNWRRASSTVFRLVENKLPIQQNKFLQQFKSYDEYDSLSIGVGSLVSILNSDISGDQFDIWGFLTPKTITKIMMTDDGDAIEKFEFNNDPEDIWPRVENASYDGHFISHSIFFGSKQAAEHALTMILTGRPSEINVKLHLAESLDEEFEDDDEDTPLQSINDIKQLLPRIIAAVQQEYDRWDENEDEYAGGGICHLIADEVCSVLGNANIDCSTVSQEMGEQHVYAIAKVREGVYSVDIPPGAYETGGGYTWKKIHDVEFDVRDIELYRITGDPAEFDDMVGY